MATATRDITLNVQTVPTLTVETLAVTDAVVGMLYQQQLVASGGIPPYTWSVVGGALPAGITLRADGYLLGVAEVGGAFNFTAQVTDSAV